MSPPLPPPPARILASLPRPLGYVRVSGFGGSALGVARAVPRARVSNSGTGFRMWLRPPPPLANRRLEARGRLWACNLAFGFCKNARREESRQRRGLRVWMVRDTGVRVPHNIKPRTPLRNRTPASGTAGASLISPLPAPPKTGAVRPLQPGHPHAQTPNKIPGLE